MVSIFQIDIFSKSVILICITFFSFFLVIMCRPFIWRELNALEFYSTMAAFITLFSGSLYISDISDDLKAFIFIFIILTNTFFGLNFLYYLFCLALNLYFENLEKLCPNKFYHILSFVENISFANIFYLFFRNNQAQETKEKLHNNKEKAKNIQKIASPKEIFIRYK